MMLANGRIQLGRVRQALDQLKGLPVVVNRLGTSKEPPRPFRRFQCVVECLVPRPALSQ